MNPQAHWFASNHLPGTRDPSKGFTRRWVFLEFNEIIPDGKKIPDFDKIILNEEREQIATA
jgi:putative DNA primase/helicase